MDKWRGLILAGALTLLSACGGSQTNATNSGGASQASPESSNVVVGEDSGATASPVQNVAPAENSTPTTPAVASSGPYGITPVLTTPIPTTPSPVASSPSAPVAASSSPGSGASVPGTTIPATGTPAGTTATTPTTATSPTIGNNVAMPDDPTKNLVGVNLGFPYNNSYAFVDAMKLSRSWVLPGFIWSALPAPADDLGYPTSDAQIVVWEGVSIPKLLVGNYTLIFNGKAESVAGIGVSGVKDLAYDASSNLSRGTLVVTQSSIPSSGVANIGLSFKGTQRTATSPKNSGVTNVHLYREGYKTDGSNTFSKEFVDAVKKFHVARFMEWNMTNGNPSMYWSDRTLPEHSTQNRSIVDRTGKNKSQNGGFEGPAGVAYEHMIQLCNEAHVDMYLNIPVNVDDEYIAKLAELIHKGRTGADGRFYPPLASDLKLYIEYGNEVWNTAYGFFGMTWVNDLAQKAYATPGHPLQIINSQDYWSRPMQYLGWRSVVISNAFRKEFGDAQMMTRIRPLLETQSAYPGYSLATSLKFIDDYYGVARNGQAAHAVNYYLYGGGGAAYYGPNIDTYTNPEYIVSHFFDATSFPDSAWLAFMKKEIAMLRDYGLKRVAYEGGVGLDFYKKALNEKGQLVVVQPRTMTLSKSQMWTLNMDPRMQDVMVKSHQAWSEHDGDLLVYYTLGDNPPWSFDADRSLVNPPAVVPKMQAIESIKNRVRAKPTIGQPIPGKLLIRDAAHSGVIRFNSGYNSVLDGVPVWDGANNVGLPVYAVTAGRYKMVVRGGIWGDPSKADVVAKGVTQVVVNGARRGTIVLVPSQKTPRLSDSELDVDLPAGFSIVRLQNDAKFVIYSATFSKI